MKVLAITACALLFPSLASAKCSMVEVLNVEPSFQNIRILTLYNGSPVKDVKLDVFSEDEQRRFSLSTSARGIAKFSLSPPGRYRIAADAANGLGADLILAVSKSHGKKDSSFTLNLALRPPPPPTLEDRIVAAENAGAVRLRQFEGVVVDFAGAVISQTKVEVFRKGSRGRARAAETASDAEGISPCVCRKGAYTAILSRGGFSTKFFVFELTEAAEVTDAEVLRVSLAVAACS